MTTLLPPHTIALPRELRHREASGGPVPYEVPLTIQPSDQIARLPNKFLGQSWKTCDVGNSSHIIHQITCGILTIQTCVSGAPVPEAEGAQWSLILEFMRARPEFMPEIRGNRCSITILNVRNDFDQFIATVNAGLTKLASRLSELPVALDRPTIYCEPVAGGHIEALRPILEGTGFALV